MKILTKKQIESVIDIPYFIEAIEEGLVLYSQKKTITAPISFLNFENPRGDVHIKSGALEGDEYYVVKIASGFYENPKIGLPSSNGLMLLFSQKTGELKAILLDEGRLTDLRTGLAGAIAAKYLAKPLTKKIGIVGTGTQAREQLYSLQFVTQCRDVLVWGRDQSKAEAFATDPLFANYRIFPVQSIDELAASCDLIVTTTSSKAPLLFGHQIRPGTHITAVGADDEGKQELDATVFEKADMITVDSMLQCSKYGDYSHAKTKCKAPVVELGEFISSPRKREDQMITISDLTGVAVEDLQVAKAVFAKL